MKAKLTLSIDEDLVEYAHSEATRRGKSVSGMVNEFLARQKQQTTQSAVPTVAEMAGSLSKYNIDYSKEAIREAYAEKYLH